MFKSLGKNGLRMVQPGHTYRCQIWGQVGDAFWQSLLWWLSAGIWVIHTNLVARWWRFLTVIWWHMNLCTVAHLWSMNIFGYDKLWGPSQRVVTLLYLGSVIKDPTTKLDKFLEKFQTAFDPPPPTPHLWKIMLQFFYNGYGCILARRHRAGGIS